VWTRRAFDSCGGRFVVDALIDRDAKEAIGSLRFGIIHYGKVLQGHIQQLLCLAAVKCDTPIGLRELPEEFTRAFSPPIMLLIRIHILPSLRLGIDDDKLSGDRASLLSKVENPLTCVVTFWRIGFLTVPMLVDQFEGLGIHRDDSWFGRRDCD